MYDSQELYVVYMHGDLVAQLEDGSFAQEAFRRRVTLLLQQFLATGQSNSYKAIQGIAKGWLRSPVQGYHYYLWWKTGSAMSWKGGRREEIYLRILRHHDETSEELTEGEIEEYQRVSPERLRMVVCFNEADGMMESPYSLEQYKVAHSRAALRLLKGLPGTGKTTSLWLSTLASAENDGARHVLYLTLSERLVERAEAFFRSLETPTRVSCLPLVSFWARLAGEQESTLFSVHEEELGRLFSTFSEKRYTPLQRWEGAWELLFAEMYGQVFGRYCFPRMNGEGGGLERVQRAVAWEFQREAYLKHRQEVLGRDGQSVVQVLQFLQRTQEEAMRRSERRGEVSQQDEEKQVTLLKLFRPLFLALWALGRLEGGGEIPEGLRGVDWIVVDEIQDLTPLEFRVLSQFWARLQEAARTSEPLEPKASVAHKGATGRVVCLLAGDEGQTARPTFFDWADVSRQFFRSPEQTETFDLRDNLRSPPSIAEILGASRDLYSAWLPKAYRPSGLSHVPSKEEVTERPAVFLVKPSPKGAKHAFARLLSFFRYLPDSVVLYPGVVYPSSQEFYEKEEGAYGRDGAEIFLLSSEVKGLDFQWVGVVDIVLEKVSEEDPLRLLRLRQAIDLVRIALSRSRERLVIFAAHGEQGVIARLLRGIALDAGDSWEGEIDDFCTEHGGYSFQEQDDQILSARLMAEKLADTAPEKALSHIQLAELLLFKQEQPNQFLLQHIVSLRMEIAYRLAILPWQGGSLQQHGPEHYVGVALEGTVEALGEWVERNRTCEAIREDWALRFLEMGQHADAFWSSRSWEMGREPQRFVDTLRRLLEALEQRPLRRLLPVFLQHSQQILQKVSVRAALFDPKQRDALLGIYGGFLPMFAAYKSASVPLIEEARQDFLVAHAIEFMKTEPVSVKGVLQALEGEEAAHRRFLVALFDLPNASALLEVFFSKLYRFAPNEQPRYVGHLRKVLDGKELGRKEEVAWLRGTLDVWEGRRPKRPAWREFAALLADYKQSMQAARREAQALEKKRREGGYLEDMMRRWEEATEGAQVREAFERDDFTRSLVEQQKLLRDESKRLLEKILLEKSKEKRDDHRDQAKERIYRILRFEDPAFEREVKGRRRLLRDLVRALSLRNVTEILRQFFLLESKLRSIRIWRLEDIRMQLLESLQRLTMSRRVEGSVEGEVRVISRTTGEERSALTGRWSAAVPVWPVGLAKVLRRLSVVWPTELALLAEGVDTLLEQEAAIGERSWLGEGPLFGEGGDTRSFRIDPRRCFPQYSSLKADLSLGMRQGRPVQIAALLWFFRTISSEEMATFFPRYYEATLQHRIKEESRYLLREHGEGEDREEVSAEMRKAWLAEVMALLEEMGTRSRAAEIAEYGEVREGTWLAYVAAHVWHEAEQEHFVEEQKTSGWSTERSTRTTVLDRFEERWPEAYREARQLFLALPFGEEERMWTWKEAFEALDEHNEAFQGTLAQHHQVLEALRRMRKMHKRLVAGEQGNRHNKDREYFRLLAGLLALDEVGETLARWGGWLEEVRQEGRIEEVWQERRIEEVRQEGSSGSREISEIPKDGEIEGAAS